MDHRSDQKRNITALYPPIEPFDQRMLDVGDGHSVYMEQCGQQEGEPVLVLHGGPGGGCSPMLRRFFDPEHYRAVLFDQRGCGRSRPHAEIAQNTTWDLVADIERIRIALGIDQFTVFGGSWGSTLALVYAITHPDRVKALVLRGVFLGTNAELDWFYRGGAAQFFPDAWARFIALIPEAERIDPIAAYNRRLFSGDTADEMRFGGIWSSWEHALASVHSDGSRVTAPLDYARAFARLENHYFMNGCFLESDGWILANRHVIEGIPTHIVQGRQDMICPPVSAHRLAEGWPRSALHLVPAAGHAISEPGITQKLLLIMDDLRNGQNSRRITAV
ncbi:prolyl aminopeptidase [Falsirhodobacter sp. alg1]|uniref:prolyl aminopeptidase n=1 Tax=Falsirhodobacter sp. alg1 TaxID=1472418 RepID=UPI0005EF895B|nr:prolyl aminopeptidase [Falsirhodobacter sp. alg1]